MSQGRQTKLRGTSPDGHGKGQDGDNAALVAQSKTKDNVGGGTSGAALGNLTDGSVGVGGVVLGDDSNEKTRPETNGNAAEDLDIGGVDSWCQRH